MTAVWSLHVLSTAGVGALLAVVMVVCIASRRVVTLWRNLLSGCTRSIGAFNHRQLQQQQQQTTHLQLPLEQLELQQQQPQQQQQQLYDNNNSNSSSSDFDIRPRDAKNSIDDDNSRVFHTEVDQSNRQTNQEDKLRYNEEELLPQSEHTSETSSKPSSRMRTEEKRSTLSKTSKTKIVTSKAGHAILLKSDEADSGHYTQQLPNSSSKSPPPPATSERRRPMSLRLKDATHKKRPSDARSRLSTPARSSVLTTRFGSPDELFAKLEMEAERVEQQEQQELKRVLERKRMSQRFSRTIELPTSDAGSCNSLLELSEEMLVYICKFLSPVDLCRLSSTCSLFNRISGDNSIWIEHCAHLRFREDVLVEPNWKRLYIDYNTWSNEEMLDWFQADKQLHTNDPRAIKMKFVMVGDKSSGKSKFLRLFGQSSMLRTTIEKKRPLGRLDRTRMNRIVKYHEDIYDVLFLKQVTQKSLRYIGKLYRGAKGIVVCFDAQDEFWRDSVNSWLRDIATTVDPNISIILCGRNPTPNDSTPPSSSYYLEKDLAELFGVRCVPLVYIDSIVSVHFAIRLLLRNALVLSPPSRHDTSEDSNDINVEMTP